MSLKRNIPYVLLVALLLIVFTGCDKGSINDVGDEVRLDYYEAVLELRANAEQLIEERSLISEESYVEVYEIVSEFAPFQDKNEEEVAYNLLEIYRYLLRREDFNSIRWAQVKIASKALTESLLEAGFDIE